jgi:hypothetical protein
MHRHSFVTHMLCNKPDHLHSHTPDTMRHDAVDCNAEQMVVMDILSNKTDRWFW